LHVADSRIVAVMSGRSDLRKGPFRSKAQDPFKVYRDYDCQEYSRCLAIASRQDWSGFTCDGCDLAEKTRREHVIRMRKEVRRIHPSVPVVPISVFLKRIVNLDDNGGYTADNFVERISHEIRIYYGERSKELMLVEAQLGLMTHGTDAEILHRRVRMLSVELGEPPDLYSIYMELCAASWQID
jgi:hypothetical protein